MKWASGVLFFIIAGVAAALGTGHNRNDSRHDY